MKEQVFEAIKKSGKRGIRLRDIGHLNQLPLPHQKTLSTTTAVEPGSIIPPAHSGINLHGANDATPRLRVKAGNGLIRTASSKPDSTMAAKKTAGQKALKISAKARYGLRILPSLPVGNSKIAFPPKPACVFRLRAS